MSSASGYIGGCDQFIGRVQMHGVLYHVEPTDRYDVQNTEFQSVMYKGNQEPLLHSQLVKTIQPPMPGNTSSDPSICFHHHKRLF